MKFRLSTSLILIKHTGLSNTCVLIFRGLGWHSAIWPNQVCAAEQDMVFGVFRLYRVHIRIHCLASWTGCHFGPETFKRVWRLPMRGLHLCTNILFSQKESNSMMLVWKLVLPCMQTIRIRRLFLERPGNFSGPKRNFEMEYCIYSSPVNPQCSSQTGQFCFLNW